MFALWSARYAKHREAPVRFIRSRVHPKATRLADQSRRNPSSGRIVFRAADRLDDGTLLGKAPRPKPYGQKDTAATPARNLDPQPSPESQLEAHQGSSQAGPDRFSSFFIHSLRPHGLYG